MISPLDIWAPIFRAPFSGDVTQEITPRFMSPEFQGNAEIEHRVQTEVASYGKQIGKILEALQVLATETGTELPEIDSLVSKVEDIKSQSKDAIRAQAVQAMAKLREVDEESWNALRSGED
ncbi:MAG: hypothetical protein VX444_09200 [Pseudomonadota bacterium]|nr:hypothetical protein [Pseudomonadota bacterium]